MNMLSNHDRRDCPTCGQNLSLSDFERNPGRRGGWAKVCLDCASRSEARVAVRLSDGEMSELLRKWRVVAKEELKA